MSIAARRKAPRPGPDFTLEQGWPGPVCGVDEAGRGPWAGPVTAAAVILDPQRIPAGLDDSKALTARARAALEVEIRTAALAFGVGFASVEEIAALNILQASGLAMRRATDALTLRPATALIDGNRVFDLGCHGVAIIRGDARSVSIAAASILAKTARDRAMEALDQCWPGYGFAAHKGYGVPAHAAALDRLGPCPEHRMSYRALQVRLARRGAA